MNHNVSNAEAPPLIENEVADNAQEQQNPVEAPGPAPETEKEAFEVVDDAIQLHNEVEPACVPAPCSYPMYQSESAMPPKSASALS